LVPITHNFGTDAPGTKLDTDNVTAPLTGKLVDDKFIVGVLFVFELLAELSGETVTNAQPSLYTSPFFGV
jgi:hypothetical protein